MAEEQPLSTTTTTTVSDVPEAEEVVINSPPSTTATVEAPPVAEATAVNGETPKVVALDKATVEEEAAVVSTSADVQNEKDTKAKALAELKLLIQNALNNHEFSTTTSAAATDTTATAAAAEAEEAKTETQPQEAVVPSESQEDSSKAVDVPKEQTDPADPQEEVIKKVNIDEDGTKTVEAIEETIVSSSTTPQQQPLPLQEAASAAGVSLLEQAVQAKTLGEEEETAPTAPEEVSIWGVPLLKDNRTDTVLWKFLLARDFRVKDAFAMIKSTIKWRKEFGIDSLVDQELVHDDDGALAKTAFMEGVSKDGNPVCYNVYGAFQNKELYQKTFSDEEKRGNFLKWRVQLLEKSVRKLDFVPGGISTIVQVNDLKNCPGPTLWELRQALLLLQDNYPEFVAKQVFINVPWWYMAVKKMINPFLTQRTKSKFVVAGPSKSAETLFSYIAPEQVPVQYGGLSRSDGEFGTKHGVTQIIVKPTSKETVEFAVTEACHLTWEVRVLGWEVKYGAEFVPNAKESYTVIIQKIRKVGATEKTIISNSFKTSEPGKVVLTIDNASSKKKRLLYRLKSNPSSD